MPRSDRGSRRRGPTAGADRGSRTRLLPADGKGDGKLGDGFFPVAGDGKVSCLMGHAAAGPKGTFLVTYTEARGVEDVNVVARIVK